METNTSNYSGIFIPNTITKVETDFYVSYNNYDINIYGSDTTAIVIEISKNPDKFFILNGDHRLELKDRDLDGCLSYFKDNINMINRFSDKLI